MRIVYLLLNIWEIKGNFKRSFEVNKEIKKKYALIFYLDLLDDLLSDIDYDFANETLQNIQEDIKECQRFCIQCQITDQQRIAIDNIFYSKPTSETYIYYFGEKRGKK